LPIAFFAGCSRAGMRGGVATDGPSLGERPQMRHIRRGGWQLLPSPQCPSREGSRYSCEGQGLLVANPRPTQASPGPILPFGRTWAPTMNPVPPGVAAWLARTS
jgi:hypothetical protein